MSDEHNTDDQTPPQPPDNVDNVLEWLKGIPPEERHLIPDYEAFVKHLETLSPEERERNNRIGRAVAEAPPGEDGEAYARASLEEYPRPVATLGCLRLIRLPGALLTVLVAKLLSFSWLWSFAAGIVVFSVLSIVLAFSRATADRMEQ